MCDEARAGGTTRVIAGLVGHAALAGCGQSLRLTRLTAAAHPPSNVGVFFAVEDARGEPIADLRADDFRIYEDGKLVPVDQGQQTLVDPERAAAHYTMLLVDLSASVTASDQLIAISSAAREFLTRLERHQRVGVYAFDGSKTLYEIVPFRQTGPQPLSGLDRLASFETKDPSTNLNGAVLAALSELDKILQRSSAALRFGSLVVFTDGTDRANRVPYQQMIDVVEASQHDVFTLGVGREIDDSSLARIGKAGYIRVEESAAAGSAFQEVAERIVRLMRRHYLLSYCSPARSGRHTLSVEVVAAGRHGQLEYPFDATGFGPGCDPTQPPAFDAKGRSRKLQRTLADVAQAERALLR